MMLGLVDGVHGSVVITKMDLGNGFLVKPGTLLLGIQVNQMVMLMNLALVTSLGDKVVVVEKQQLGMILLIAGLWGLDVMLESIHISSNGPPASPPNPTATPTAFPTHAKSRRALLVTAITMAS